MTVKSKRVRVNEEKVDFTKVYSLPEGLELLKSMSKVKFDETVEFSALLGVNPKKSDQLVRGSISLPKGIGKSRKVIVFAEGDDIDKVMKAGAFESGGLDLVKKIEGGWMDFDVAIAPPYMMKHIGKLGRILGPQGKMPSPKAGTVTENLENAVKEYSAGKIEFRVDSGSNIHVPVGKLSFTVDDLVENINTFVEYLKTLKPATAKGAFIKNMFLSSTMGPGIAITV